MTGYNRVLGALCPSKSGLMNKHIVKHIVNEGLVHHPEKDTDRQLHDVPSSRPSPHKTLKYTISESIRV